MNILGFVPKMHIKFTYICNETDISHFKGRSYAQQAARNLPVWQMMYLDSYILYFYLKGLLTKNQTIVFGEALLNGKELLLRASSTGIQVLGGPKLLSMGMHVCII
jgi:hypothetical protein